MNKPSFVSRRTVLKQGGSALAVLALFDSPLFAWGREGEIPVSFKDRPPNPSPGNFNMLDWQNVENWITPREKFFHIGHYGEAEVDAASWKLEISGLVSNQTSYTLDDIKKLPKEEIDFTLECSGNGGSSMALIGNGRWGGTPLAPILEKAGIHEKGDEIVFWGADSGEETVPYIGGGGEKREDFVETIHFARSLSLQKAMHPDNLLCYELNGEPLPKGNGYPLRLICPGWYGIANVKWLSRIEVMDKRFLGPFMAMRYITAKDVPRESGGTELVRTSVGKANIKSIPAKVTVRDGNYRIYGAAWGAPITEVEVRIDGGEWRQATITEGLDQDYAWKFWHLDWNDVAPGEHEITSRATARDGEVQPSPTDWQLSNKRTYWEGYGQITRKIEI
jgi:DMSO/TMAO reductase YedYZ molybdopterin-dependent catalytic subunit